MEIPGGVEHHQQQEEVMEGGNGEEEEQQQQQQQEEMGMGQRPQVLDGAFGTLLASLGFPVQKDVLWSGAALIDAPALVRTAHGMFIDAGADIIETNTYHVCIPKLMESRGYTRDEANSVLQKAVDIAREAIAMSGRSANVQLVGSVGPYATYLRDGSEYTGAYVKKPDFKEQTIIDYYIGQCQPLLAAGIRTLVFETIPSLKEAECVGTVLQQLGPNVQAWLVSTCQDGKCTRSGDLFADVVRIANSQPKVVAVGVNCTAPEHVTELLEEANRANNAKALVVYPNSGEVWNPESQQFRGPTQIDIIAALIPCWYELGARIFGGCCRVTPAHIAQIADVCHRKLGATAKQQPQQQQKRATGGIVAVEGGGGKVQ